MRTRSAFLSAAIAACLVVFPGSALASTVSFAFQGYLDLNGEPCEGTYKLRFALEKENQDEVDSLEKEVTIRNGHFVTVLDFPRESFEDTNKLYLRVIVYEDDGVGETQRPLMNRQRLMPAIAAYAAPSGSSFQVEAIHSPTPHIEVSTPLGDIETGDIHAGTVFANRFVPQYVSNWRSVNVESDSTETFWHDFGTHPSHFVVQMCGSLQNQECVGPIRQLTQGYWPASINPWTFYTEQNAIRVQFKAGYPCGFGLICTIRVLAWR